MKAVVFASLWLSIGAVVAWRRPAPLGERLLSWCFWPLFLLAPVPQGSAGGEDPPSLVRLRGALRAHDSAPELADGLSAAFRRLDLQVGRLGRALSEVGPEVEGPIGAARRRSREILSETLDRTTLARDEALAAIEEASSRLVVASEDGDRQDVAELLRSLRARLDAMHEVEHS